MKTHWLYGMGPNKEIEFDIEIDVEHQCSKCIHKKVCAFIMPSFCTNFKFGTSEGNNCDQCIHHFTRYDQKQPIPCFHCKHFKDSAE